MDGAAVVHILPNGESNIFAEFGEVVSIPRVILELGNPTRGSRLGCICEGQSETYNEGKQRDRNTQESVWPFHASGEPEKLLTK